jgi:hypothetical protein
MRICLEMQDLWLRTRIRRDEYAFLGDLRRLARRSIQDTKMNWGRIHTAIGDRLTAFRDAAGAPVDISGTFAERVEAVRDALATRAATLTSSGEDRTGVLPESVDVAGVDRGCAPARRAILLEETLADLGARYLPQLPPAVRPTTIRRALERINVLSLQRADPPHDRLVDSWRQMRLAVRRLDVWRVNPFTLVRHALRDVRHAVLFFYALLLERY